MLGCPGQRCSVHLLRRALGHARREQQPMLAALLRPLFNADTRELVGDTLARLRKPLPRIAAHIEKAQDRAAASKSVKPPPLTSLGKMSVELGCVPVGRFADSTTKPER